MKHKALHGDGSKRLRPEGCWSFCGKPGQCQLEKIGACRTFIPRIECPPPNQGCPDIHGLVFGKKDYFEEIAEWERMVAKFPVEKNTNWRPPNDPFAMIPIYFDPRKYLKGDKVELWNPDRLQDAILSSGEILSAINEAGKYDEDPFTTKEFYDLRGKLISLFAKLFTRTLSPGNDRLKSRAIDVFMTCVDTVAIWCLEQYCTDQEHWMGLVLKYGKVKTIEEIEAGIKEASASSKMSFFTGTDEEFSRIAAENAAKRIEDDRRKQEREHGTGRGETGGYDFDFSG